LGSASCPWLTFHIAQFAQPLASEAKSFDGPSSAIVWRFGPDSPLGANGLRTRIGDVWGGVGLYTAHAMQSWHAMLQPIAHRGEVNWFGPLQGNPTLDVAGDDPGGLMVVLTTAGYDALPPEKLQADLPRRIDFLANVERVRAWYATLPVNLARGVFNFAPPGTDGLTFSVWKEDAAMTDAAYRGGTHRAQIDRYKTEKTADRTSFTRARLVHSSGTWRGNWNSADLV
jgi:hypothetical protein